MGNPKERRSQDGFTAEESAAWERAWTEEVEDFGEGEGQEWDDDVDTEEDGEEWEDLTLFDD